MIPPKSIEIPLQLALDILDELFQYQQDEINLGNEDKSYFIALKMKYEMLREIVDKSSGVELDIVSVR